MAGTRVVELMENPQILKKMIEEADGLEYASDFANLLRVMLDTIENERERIASMIDFMDGPMNSFSAWKAFASSEEQFKEELRRWRERSITK